MQVDLLNIYQFGDMYDYIFLNVLLVVKPYLTWICDLGMKILRIDGH